MTETHDNFLEAVLELLRGVNPSAEAIVASGAQIDADTDLIEAGVIDSLSIMELIVFLERETGVEVSLEDLLLDSIRTARTIDSVYGPATSGVA